MKVGHTQADQSGFTLIEICITLLLIMAIFAMAAGIVRMGVKDSDLSEVRDQMGLLVLRTRALAMETGREQELQIGADRLVLETDEETKKFPRTLEIPPAIKMEIQIWPNDRWILPEKEVSWLFQPNGICMPLSFRFSKGTSFVSFRIHPLTGAVDQESRMIESHP